MSCDHFDHDGTDVRNLAEGICPGCDIPLAQGTEWGSCMCCGYAFRMRTHGKIVEISVRFIYEEALVARPSDPG